MGCTLAICVGQYAHSRNTKNHSHTNTPYGCTCIYAHADAALDQELGNLRLDSNRISFDLSEASPTSSYQEEEAAMEMEEPMEEYV